MYGLEISDKEIESMKEHVGKEIRLVVVLPARHFNLSEEEIKADWDAYEIRSHYFPRFQLQISMTLSCIFGYRLVEANVVTHVVGKDHGKDVRYPVKPTPDMFIDYILSKDRIIWDGSNYDFQETDKKLEDLIQLAP